MDFDALRADLRTELNKVVERVMGMFGLASARTLTNDDDNAIEEDTLDMEWGGTGVLFSLYKYSLLLAKEKATASPNWLEEALKDALDNNIKARDGATGQHVTFWRSKVIGVSTLACLNILKDTGKKDIDF